MRLHTPTKIIFVILILLAAAGLVAAAVFHARSQNKATPTNQSKIVSQEVNITSLPVNGLVSSPLTIKGTASNNWYFEAVFPVKLVDGSGKVLAQGQAQAQSQWTNPGQVPFVATLTFTSPGKGVGMIILNNGNPSGMAENSKQFTWPVKFGK